MSYEVNVDRGCVLLDRDMPDWRNRVDRDILNMKLNDSCILGQLFGGYLKGLDKLGIPGYTTDDADCGFDVPKEDISDEAYEKLTDEWKRRLRGVTL